MDSSDINQVFSRSVVKRLHDAGYQALYAGGCVRDLLMGTSPKDYDIATDARPDQVRDLFGKSKTIAVGAAFGVIVVLPTQQGVAPVEVATFRTDAQYSDGRRPDHVTFCNAEQDALRRDFTINGMFFDPLTESVIDYVNGQEDLKQGVIRAIGDAEARIDEDKLRMLRAIRFAATFHFSIARETLAAISAHSDEILVVSSERIAAEMQKTLAAQEVFWAIHLWRETQLLKYLIPELAEASENEFEKSTAIARCSRVGNWRVRLAALLWPLSRLQELWESCSKTEAYATNVQQRLRFSNEDTQAIASALWLQQALDHFDVSPWSKLQPRLLNPHIRDGIELLFARRCQAYGQAKATEGVLGLEKLLNRPRGELDPSPLLTGNDLIQLGLKPGPEFRELLSEVRALQLDGLLENTDQALGWVRSRI